MSDKRAQLIEMAGLRFGRLTVLARAANARGGAVRWECVCDCGGKAVSAGYNLRRGGARSCGCLQRETVRGYAHKAHAARTKHGHCPKSGASPEHATWAAMLGRCSSPTNKQYPNYGGRGITVCERWLVFENFLSDMGERPAGLSLDRKNNDGNYEPGNCRWATLVEQNNNTRANRRIVYRGQEMTVAQAIRAAELPTSPITIRRRLANGWPVERAFT